uniref:PINIT domain-containing protein n=1 Tax=Romanomermis culicivorax TaxID=13658 RepID=A0A915L7T0_ROMCU
MAYFAGNNGIVVFDGNESTEEELKKMLFCFRVHELQHLLGFANRSKLGKKNELIQRAIDLVRTTKSLQIQEKVRELYRKRLHQDSRYSTPDLQMIDPRDSYRQCTTSISPPVYPGHHSAYNSYNNVQTTSNNSHLVMNSKILDSLSAANVKFINLPFYDVIIPLLKPTVLRTTNPGSKFQENYLPFTLNVQQLEDIQYVDTAPLPRTEVQLRFCLYDTSREQKDDFPTGVEVRINEKQVVLPNLIPTNKPGVEPKRPSRPVNITTYCRDSPTERMHIYWAGDNDKFKIIFLVITTLRRQAYVHRLVAQFFTIVLKDAPHGISEVELLENGSWVPIKDEDEGDDDEDEAETSVVMHAQTKSATSYILPISGIQRVEKLRSLKLNYRNLCIV